ncbi:unnamed protein product [Rhodiola kirilowii]
MKKCGDLMDGLKPAMLMVMVQASFAGVNVFVKLAVNNGMNLTVLIAYRFIFATAFVLPIALVVERKNRPKLTPKIVFQGFLCGLFGGTLLQFLYFGCLVVTSATFASAIGNLVPAATFILAVIFRMEKLRLRTLPGKLKVFGTVLGVIGAMTLTFFKGVEFDIWKTHIDLMKIVGRGDSSSAVEAHSHNQVLGFLLGGSSCIAFGLWLIIQKKLSDAYPCQYSCTALLSLMAAVQSTVFALCTVQDWSQWRLEFDIRLFTVVYSGALVSGMMVSVIAWCIRMRGPLFVSVFSPLMLVMVALASSLLLNEKLSAGSVIGAVLIVAGLYMVLWGKGKELKSLKNQVVPAGPMIPKWAEISSKPEDSKAIDIVIDAASEQHDNKKNHEEPQLKNSNERSGEENSNDSTNGWSSKDTSSGEY